VTDVVAEARRWYLSRISAMVLGVCVVVHLATIIHAVQGGLTAGEILARTRGNIGFAAFYGAFVLACAVHVPVGLEAIACEWLRLPASAARGLAWAVAALIVVMGLRAVYGLYA
jgi:fumarate reductase subunit C